MARITLEIPKPEIKMKLVKKTSQSSGVIEVGDLTSPGELLCDTSRKIRGRI